MKNTTHVWILITVIMGILVPSVLAPTAVEYVDPGTTPDSFWYGLELFWEGIVEAEEDHTDERFSEMHAMIVVGDYVAAGEAAEAAKASIEDISRKAEAVEPSDENLGVIQDYEEQVLLYEAYREDLEQDLQEQAGVEEVPEDILEEIGLEAIEEVIVEGQFVIETREEAITDAIAEERGITHLEAKLLVEAAGEAAGLAERHQEEVEEGLVQAEKDLDLLQSDLAAAIGTGENVPPQAIELIAKAQAHLYFSQSAYYDVRYGESFSQFISAEHLIDTANGFLKDEVSSAELAQVVEASREQSIENNQEYLNEYKEHLDRWIEEYPQYADTFDDWAEQSKNELALYIAIGEEPFTPLQEQLRASGKTDEEIFKAVSDQYRDEYERAFGVPYIPPVFESVDDGSVIFNYDEKGNIINPADDNSGFGKKSTPFDSASTKGGFFEGHVYIDPVSGYKYEFTDSGYKYTTPLGITYEQTLPKDFTIPTAYEKGNEQHSYTTATPKGMVTYNYYATGYDVTFDGKTETYPYPAGGYDVAGGGFFDHSATGFDFRHEGELNHYDYNPVYDTFIGSGGITYRPPEGTYFQHEALNYNYESHLYEFDDDEEEAWSYDPGSGSWSSSTTGKTYTPIAQPVAPIGHEGTGSFSTKTGETWNYDPVAQSWTSSTGETFTSVQGTATGSYADSSGKSYDYHPEAGGTFADPHTGEIWSQDSSGSWSSSSGATYSSGTESSGSSYGGHAPPTGGFESGTSGSYSGDGHTDSGSYSAPSGDGGGSAPGGGDAGGGGHSDGGGDGGGGGMGGYAVREPREAKELHPVTRWIYKYLRG